MRFRVLGPWALAGLLAGCQDDPVAVQSKTIDLRPFGSGFRSTVLPGDSPDLASASTSHNASTGAGPHVFVAAYPDTTVVTASASGFVGWTHDNGSTGGWGPGGYDNGMRGYAYMSQKRISPAATYDWSFSQYYYSGQWVNPVAVNIKVKDSVFIVRSASSINLNSNGLYYCGPAYPQNPECFTHSGSTTLTLTRATADLQFTADSMSVAVGSTVTFKNKVVNPSVTSIALPKTILRYVWIPDDTSKGGNASEVIDSSYAACTSQLPADSTCTRVIQGSGTLRIVARVNGKTTEKSIRVNAIPCPTGDPVLDHKEIRKALMQMWNVSNADSAPGSGRDSTCRNAFGDPVTCGFKREQGVWIFKRSDSSYYAVSMTPTYQDECTIVPGNPPSPPEAGSNLVAVAHSHPSKNGDKLYCDTKDQHGKPADLYPNDPVGKWVAKKGKDWSRGGGSTADWKMAQSSPNLDVYTMNKNDEIYRLPAYTPAGSELSSRNARRKYWRGNKAACPF